MPVSLALMVPSSSPFSPYTADYDCSITTDSGTAFGFISAERRDGQIYTVEIGEGTTEGSGASIMRSTNIGQKSYRVIYGAGGNAIAPEDLPEGYVSGTTAEIVLDVKVYIDNAVVNTYKVTIHRTYLEPDS